VKKSVWGENHGWSDRNAAGCRFRIILFRFRFFGSFHPPHHIGLILDISLAVLLGSTTKYIPYIRTKHQRQHQIGLHAAAAAT
jgi:hypothetical protein